MFLQLPACLPTFSSKKVPVPSEAKKTKKEEEEIKVKMEDGAEAQEEKMEGKEEEERTEKEKEEEEEEPSMVEVGEGQIGELIMYESGRCKLQYGSVLLDITEANECGFPEEVLALDADNRNAFILGRVVSRLVGHLDVDDLLQGDSDFSQINLGMEEE